MRRFIEPLVFAAILLSASACGKKDAGPTPVASVVVTPVNPSLAADDSLVLTARTLDASGNALTGRNVTWRSETAIIATVTQAGLLTAVDQGSAVIVATSEGKEGRVTVTVTPPPLASITLSPPLSPVRVGGTAQLSYAVLNTRGQPVSAVPLTFTSSNPAVATVTSAGVVSGVSLGTTTVRAAAGTIIGEVTLNVLGAQNPSITSVEPASLVPNAVASLRGVELRDDNSPSATLVLIGGQQASILSVSDTMIQVRVPCLVSGAAALQATIAQRTINRSVVIGTPNLTSGVGSAQPLPPSSEHCVQIAASSTPSRYLIMAYNTATSPNTLGSLTLAGNYGTAAVATMRPTDPPAFSLSRERSEHFVRDTAHLNFLERERELYLTLRAAPRERTTTLRRSAPLPALGDIRPIFYTFSGGCGDTTRVIQGRAIRVGTRAIIWEDTANTIKSTQDAALAGFYERLGKQFDDEQYDVIRKYFGDPLRRDAETDADGRLSMVYTQRLNGSGAAAYVTSCDQRTRAVAPGSNVGEYFYGAVPTTSIPNLNTTSAPDGWFYFMGRTVVHEVKHIASIAARFANNASFFEQSWLEEGTARHAEELWVRDYVHNVPWKGNTGFGTANDNGLFCDFHPDDATCAAVDPLHRPTYGMRRQFNEIRDKLLAPWDWSPFGNGSGQTGGIFYQTAWSMVRYAIDQYATSDSAFFQTLINSNLVGAPNVEASAGGGASMDDILRGWGLALYADDYPGFTAAADVSTQFPTWNLRSIYQGLNSSPNWSARWPAEFPMTPTALSFGVFQSGRNGIRGGGHAYFELSGTPTEPQLLRVLGTSGMRFVVLRLQ